MKKLFIIAIIGTSLVFQNCGTKEKQEKTDMLNDSIITETVIIDSVTTENGTSVITEDLNIQNEPVDKSTTVTKITTKEPAKVVTQTTTQTKVGTNTTTEVETKVVVTEEPKKVVVAETPVKVTVKEPTVAIGTSNWVVPAKYQTMKNPTDPKVDLAIGKSLYGKHCKSCHGSEGYGDGVKAKEMKGDLGDFSSKKFQSQTDGALFYKTTFGRDDMPAYNKKIPSDEDRWLIVNYMRTL
ncbi:MAG: cytochrome c [Lutibacter sp.]|nr:cytochrome c [Lutibacter sp.]